MTDILAELEAAPADPAIEAERFVLGALLVEIDDNPGADGLAPGDFYHPRHGAIFREIRAARGAGEPADAIAIGERLRAAGDLQRVGGMSYLAECVSVAMGAGTVAHHAAIVQKAARRRERLELLARAGRIAADDDAWTARGPELLEQLAGQRSTVAEATPLARLRAALVDSAGLDDIPDPEPLIGEDILFRDSLAWIVGKPGCGKSFVMLDMAGCVGTGTPWHDQKVQQGPVLYLVAEGARGTKKRVRAWETAMGQRMENVHFLPLPVQSTNAAEWDALVELARELAASMIVIDTQARVTVGVEENSNTEMGRFVHQAERLREASSACVAIVHHIGRNGDTGRGATVLDGALSTIIKVGKDENRIKLECTKNKDAEEWDDIELRAVPVGDGAARSIVLMPDDGLRRDGGAAEVTSAAQRTARTWWESHADTWVGKSDLVDVVAPKTTLFRHLTELRRAGLVEMDTSSKYPRYRFRQAPDGAL